MQSLSVAREDKDVGDGIVDISDGETGVVGVAGVVDAIALLCRCWYIAEPKIDRCTIQVNARAYWQMLANLVLEMAHDVSDKFEVLQ